MIQDVQPNLSVLEYGLLKNLNIFWCSDFRDTLLQPFAPLTKIIYAVDLRKTARTISSLGSLPMDFFVN